MHKPFRVPARLRENATARSIYRRLPAAVTRGGKPVLHNRGFCYSCNNDTRFASYADWLRDNYLCARCGSIPRERAIMFCIDRHFPAWRDLTIHESSPAARATSRRLSTECSNYIGSQYYPDIPLGGERNGFRNENLEKLTFDDNSVDLHITQDVFEHIFDPAAAFREIARTLKPGGAHIFTTPIVNKDAPTRWCAKLNSDGSIQHLIDPPEYHGNPVSDDGALVTVHWGFDITQYIFEASGLFTDIVYIDALEYGIRAEYIEVLITHKP